MEPVHQRILMDNISVLSNNVSLENIRPLLEKYKIFNKYMWLDIHSVSDVLKMLPSRGPEAYQNIIHILRKANYPKEADLLEKGRISSGRKFPKHLIYEMTSKTPGYCLLINNVKFDDPKKNRYGSDVDARNITSFFKEIGYEVYPETNMKAFDMDERIKKFSQMQFKSVGSCFVIILSHGGQKENQDYIEGTDGEFIFKKDIVSYFSNSKCIEMQRKPKIFFFVACRGVNRDYGAPNLLSSESADSSGMGVMPSLSDILIVHSSLPDNISMRDHAQGSWFCQDLITTLKDNCLEYDLEDLVIMANDKLKKRVSNQYRVTQAAHSENLGFNKFFLCGSPLML